MKATEGGAKKRPPQLSAAEKAAQQQKHKRLRDSYNGTLQHSWSSDTLKGAYTTLELLGSGAYGKVYSVKKKSTGEIFAVKQFTLQRETQGFPKTAIQEMMWLKQLRHENIVHLHDIVVDRAKEMNRSRGAIHLIMEFVPFDLDSLMKLPGQRLTDLHIKCYLHQLLQAVHFVHSRYVLNRDIKPANILITYDNRLKLADWGLAREFNPLKPKDQKTQKVVTIWYRAPELLMQVGLDYAEYGTALDMWSVGCVFGEMLMGGRVMFPAAPPLSEKVQLDLIWKTLGGWCPETWPGVERLPCWPFLALYKRTKSALRAQVSRISSGDESALNLIELMLHPDPKQRINAKDALLNEYFWEKSGTVKWTPEHLPKRTEETVKAIVEQKKATTRRRAKNQRHRPNQRSRKQQPPPVDAKAAAKRKLNRFAGKKK